MSFHSAPKPGRCFCAGEVRMNRRDLIEDLCSRFSQGEWDALLAGAESVPVNEFNRSALVRMRACDQALDEELPADEVAELDGMLADYMATYLPENVPAQKYFVASCLSLAFVLREPMHPLEAVHAVTEAVDGSIVYRCPSKVTGERNICDWCVCEKLEA